MQAVVHVFPDTNIFLHFSALDGLDWCRLCETDRTVLHITQPLLTELNKAKDTGGGAAVRKRATTVQQRLSAIHDGDDPRLPAGVAIKFHSISPDPSRFPGLNVNVADDHLLAAVLLFKQSEPEAEVVLATDDNGFGLIVKCGSTGVKVVKPFESDRIPPELDERDQELRKLRKENEQLRNARPKIAIGFPTGGSLFRFSLEAIDVDAKTVAAMSKIREKHRELRVPESTGNSPFSVSMYNVMLTPERVSDYNSKLQKFFVAFEDAARSVYEQRSRTFVFQVIASNSGSAPAEDLSVHLYFPDGFVLRTEEEWTALQSKLPRPPDTPTSIFERGLAGIGNHVFSPTHFGAMHARAPLGPSLSIKKTHSYDVHFAHPKLRQGHDEVVGDFALTFDVAPHSFEVGYRVVADNVPEFISGKLHFAFDAP